MPGRAYYSKKYASIMCASLHRHASAGTGMASPRLGSVVEDINFLNFHVEHTKWLPGFEYPQLHHGPLFS